MYNISSIGPVLLLFALSLNLSSCKERNASNQSWTPVDQSIQSKPPSSFNDTFKIFKAAAVIYVPDSRQFEKIRSTTDPQIFDGQMHEYEYQLKYSKKVLLSEWPQIPVFEPKNIRFLFFQTFNGNHYIIDLNEYHDPYGIILFNFKDRPTLADMTNFEQALYQIYKN